MTEKMTYYIREKIDLAQLQEKHIIIGRATTESKGTDSGRVLHLVIRK